MIINNHFKVCHLIPRAVLIISLCLGAHANAQDRSFLIDLNSGTAIALGTLGGGYTLATALNDAGQVVGRASTADGKIHAFITGPDGTGMRDLGSLVGGAERINGGTEGINDAGQVVGWAGQRAFITGPDGMGMRDLGTLGGTWSTAFDINDAGQVVGQSQAAGSPHAFMTGPDGVGMRELGRLGDLYLNPFGINGAGQVVGGSEGFDRAFITGPNGMGIKDLGSLGGEDLNQAEGINDVGQVVGWSGTAEGPQHAFITGPNGMGMRDLGDLGGGMRAGLMTLMMQGKWWEVLSLHLTIPTTLPITMGMRSSPVPMAKA